MDREAWQSIVHGVARVRHYLATKLPPPLDEFGGKYIHAAITMICVMNIYNNSKTFLLSSYYFCVLRTSNIYSLSNLQVYSTELLPIINMLYIRSPEPSHLSFNFLN